MNKLIATISILCIFSFELSAQINLKGQVLFNKKPKSNATVYVNNTTVGTTTNSNGEFSLSLKNGVYQLIISHVGFKTINYDFDSSTYANPLIFTLIEDKSVLNEVVVSVKRYDAEWEYNLSVFSQEFIGTSEFSKSCTILNPDVLFFDYDVKSNTLTAEALEPLHIRNKALGYDIFYDLEHFSRESKTTRYLGYSYFKELKRNKNRWRKNRLKAYNGSPIHFYKSVLNNTTEEEGFVINQFVREKNPEKPSQQEVFQAKELLASYDVTINFSRIPEYPENAIDSALVVLSKARLPEYIDYLYTAKIAPSDIIRTNKNDTYLQFKNNLRITYLHEKEEEGYILRNPFSEPRKAYPQASNIITLVDKTLLYPEGILANPLDVIYEEYWSFEKLAHSLPLDYNPTKKK